MAGDVALPDEIIALYNATSLAFALRQAGDVAGNKAFAWSGEFYLQQRAFAWPRTLRFWDEIVALYNATSPAFAFRSAGRRWE